jgi:hypothetical protein
MDALLAQWRSNRRLRYASGIALLFLVIHVAAALAGARAATIAAYREGQALLVRLQGAADDDSWLARAAEAEEALRGLESGMPVAAGASEAQAELQAQLQALAAQVGMVQPRIRAESAMVLDDLPGIRVVLARLDGGLNGDGVSTMLKALAERPWLRVERIDLRDGSPGQAQIVVRAHFRPPTEEGA